MSAVLNSPGTTLHSLAILDVDLIFYGGPSLVIVHPKVLSGPS